LQTRWRTLHQRYGRGRGFDDFWSDAVQHGGVYGDVAAQTVRLVPGIAQLLGGLAGSAGESEQQLLIVFPSIALHDGRGANKPWLQELPDPVSKITWHGWVEVHPETAAKSQLANGDMLLLTSPYGAVRAPVWITPGVRPDVLAVPSGQGHRLLGLRHRVLRREQPRDGGRGARHPTPPDELAPHRALLHRRRGGRAPGRRPRDADVVPAVRQRALRAGVSGVRRVPHARRLERPGLQPLR